MCRDYGDARLPYRQQPDAVFSDEHASVVEPFRLVEDGAHFSHGHLGVRRVLDRSHVASFI